MLYKLKISYAEIGKYLITNYKFCIFTILIVAELIVYSVLNANPSSGDYVAYVNENFSKYDSLFAFIFIENCKTSVLIVLTGIIPFLIGPLFSSFATVYPLAAVLKQLMLQFEIGFIISGTAAHGVFELPAILLSIMVSFLISKEITLGAYEIIRDKKSFRRRLCNIKKLLACWLLVIVPALMVSAFIESYLTPLLLK